VWVLVAGLLQMGDKLKTNGTLFSGIPQRFTAASFCYYQAG
jgi:hypothetical protein